MVEKSVNVVSQTTYTTVMFWNS